jgi:hypothetical protein
MLGKQHNYASQRENVPSIVNGSIDLHKTVNLVTTHDSSSEKELNYKIFSSQNWVSFEYARSIYANNQQGLKESKEINDQKKTKKVFIKGEFPREIKRKNYGKVINEINKQFVEKWQKIKELEDKDIDVNLSFESDPETSDLEMTYTIYVMDLNKSDVEIVWNKLRKLLNEVFDNIKHNLRRYRSKVENLEKLAVIHIEW